MERIEQHLKKAIEIAAENFGNDPGIKELEHASIEFKNLIEKGVTKNRGYNLLSRDEAFSGRIAFNTK